MLKKTTILAVGAVGYVLGARAGRERYDQIMNAAGRVRRNPQVRKAASQAQDFVAEQAPVVKDRAQEAAEKAASAAKSAADSARDKMSSSDSQSDGPGLSGAVAPGEGH